jgi:hypothetical protein
MPLPLIQVVLFYFFIFIVYWFSAAITWPPSSNSDGDYIMLFTAIIFPVIVLVQNVVAALINNTKATYVLVGIAIAFYTFLIIDMGFSVPFKTGLCMFFGLLVLGIKTKIDKRLL